MIRDFEDDDLLFRSRKSFCLDAYEVDFDSKVKRTFRADQTLGTRPSVCNLIIEENPASKRFKGFITNV
jgi:hypothetical protein